MEAFLLHHLQKITLTADEEESFVISKEQRGDQLSVCILSLVGKFLSVEAGTQSRQDQ
jgi:hypothetical protein